MMASSLLEPKQPAPSAHKDTNVLVKAQYLSCVHLELMQTLVRCIAQLVRKDRDAQISTHFLPLPLVELATTPT